MNSADNDVSVSRRFEKGFSWNENEAAFVNPQIDLRQIAFAAVGRERLLSLAAPAARLRQRSAAAISGRGLRPAYLQSIYEHDSVARLAHTRPPLCSPSRSQLKQLCRSLSLRWLPWASRLLRL